MQDVITWGAFAICIFVIVLAVTRLIFRIYYEEKKRYLRQILGEKQEPETETEKEM